MRQAMIFAAGLGTRLKPLTDNKPKALVEVSGTPLLEIVIKQLIKYDFNEIVINVHHFAEQIIDFLDKKKNFGITIHISDERGELLETGGGMKKAAHFFNSKPFIVHNVDILSDINLSDLYDFHIQKKALVTLAVKKRKTQRYFLFDNTNTLCGWRNFKTNDIKISRPPQSKLQPIAFSGIQVVDPKIFSLIKTTGAFSITNTYITLAGNHPIYAYNHDSSFWMDLGKIENIIEAEKFINKFI